MFAIAPSGGETIQSLEEVVPIVDLLIGAVDLVFFLSSSLSQGTTSMANPNFQCTL